METINKILEATQSSDLTLEKQTLGLNFQEQRTRQMVQRVRGFAQVPGSMRPTKSIRPKQIRPFTIMAEATKAK